MITLTVRQVTKTFGRTSALDGLDLRVEPGEFFFVLGPSGCGKTTLLRCLAGFHRPDRGRILFDADDVTDVPPHKRNTGMMFQNCALWPHLTVAENVAFGLEERKVRRAEIRRRVGEALESVRMSESAARRPTELSGGQQQRVALARALVIRPRCLLLDEPLSNLDARLRLEMRTEIRRVCKESKVTTVCVTHDQKEALAIADRMAILEGGRVGQVGTPVEVYRRPLRRSIAHFLGEANFIPGKLLESAKEGGKVAVGTSLGRFDGFATDPAAALRQGADVFLLIRPECWRLQEADPGSNRVRGRVSDTSYLGESARHDFLAGGTLLGIAELNPRRASRPSGGELYAVADPEDVNVLAG